MKKEIQLIIIFLVPFIFNCQAQDTYIQCGKEKLVITRFVTDSMSSFNNKYVQYEAIKSIKQSKFPVEVRIYSTGISSDIIQLMMFQATPDSIIITNKRIWLAGKAGINNYKIVKRGGSYTVNVSPIIQKRSSINSYCEFLSQLISNHLFEIKGSLLSEKFVQDPNKSIEDSGGSYLFEIKINNKYRNFEYHTSGNAVDPHKTRGKSLINIISTTFKTLKINEKN